MPGSTFCGGRSMILESPVTGGRVTMPGSIAGGACVADEAGAAGGCEATGGDAEEPDV
jgi:hypothetical protein